MTCITLSVKVMLVSVTVHTSCTQLLFDMQVTSASKEALQMQTLLPDFSHSNLQRIQQGTLFK